MNQDASSFLPSFLIPSLTLTFTDFPHHPAPLPEEIIVLNAEDGDDDVDDEFLMADDARLVGH